MFIFGVTFDVCVPQNILFCETSLMGFEAQELGFKFWFLDYLGVWLEKRFNLSQPQVPHLQIDGNNM